LRHRGHMDLLRGTGKDWRMFSAQTQMPSAGEGRILPGEPEAMGDMPQKLVLFPGSEHRDSPRCVPTLVHKVSHGAVFPEA
jgi:hypothetical protein